jgi:hypothetical protein
MMGLDLAVGFLVDSGVLESVLLALGDHDAFLGRVGLQALQAIVLLGEAVADPDAADAESSLLLVGI